MNRWMIKRAHVMLAAVGVTLSVSTAYAGPLVTNWNYRTDAGFHDTNDSNPGTTPSSVIGDLTNPELNLPTRLSWGDADAEIPGIQGPQSSFSIKGSGADATHPTGTTPGEISGSLVTNGPAVIGLALEHDNRPVFGETLASTILRNKLFLTPTAPPPHDGSVTFGPPALEFPIQFRETPNQTPCTVSGGPACKDIFVANVIGAGFDPDTLSFVQPFDFDGNTYTASIFLDGLGILPAAACEDVLGTGNTNCIGFTTNENATNSFQATFTITARVPPSVPEPGILTLFASGLIGMRWMRRQANFA